MSIDAAPTLFTSAPFSVELDVYSGPFDVLLTLIARKQLDITDVALAEVTDEFIAFLAEQDHIDVDVLSEFVVVAATLLDIKAARLLPREILPEEIDYDILEARDLLFAKLLQYRAYKLVAARFAERMATASLAVARSTIVPEEFRTALPEVKIGATTADLARMAVQAFTRTAPTVALEHLHSATVAMESQIEWVREAAFQAYGEDDGGEGSDRRRTFARLCGDTRHLPTIVARFLAVLELLRRGEIAVTPRGFTFYIHPVDDDAETAGDDAEGADGGPASAGEGTGESTAETATEEESE